MFDQKLYVPNQKLYTKVIYLRLCNRLFACLGRLNLTVDK
jgi:hypothetical protein